MLVGLDVGIAAKRGERCGDVLLGLRQRLFGGVGGVLGRIEVGLGRDALGEQVLLALQDLRLEVVVVLGRLQCGQRLLVGGAVLGDLEARRGQRRIGLVERDLEGLRIDAEEEIAGGNRLVLLGIDLGDPSGHVGIDGHAILLDIGIVGRHVASAGQPEIGADEDQHDRHRRHDEIAADVTARLGLRSARRDAGRRSGLRSVWSSPIGTHEVTPSLLRAKSERVAWAVAPAG